MTDDDDLVVLAAHGDDRAITDLYYQLRQRIRPMIRRNDEDALTEVLNATLLEGLALVAIGRVPADMSAQSYLVVIAERKAKQYYWAQAPERNKKDNITTTFAEPLEKLEQGEGASPDDGPYYWFHLLEQCLNQLTEKQREVILLVYDGYKPKEIGEQLGIRPGTVSQRLFRGMSKLQDLLSSPRKTIKPHD